MVQREHRNTFLTRLRIKTDKMKKAISILATAAMLTACSTHRNSTVNPMLLGTWEQPNITLDLKSNGHYKYIYKQNDYTNKQSGRYYADKGSLVLYGFYPDAYTPDSKNVRWSIRKLTPDPLTVYVHKDIVVLDNDTLNTAGNEIETYTRKKSIN